MACSRKMLVGVLCTCTLCGCTEYESTCWEPVYESETVGRYVDIWGSPDGQLFVIGDAGDLLEYSPNSGWSKADLRVTGGGVYGNSPSEVYLAHSGRIYKREGQSWTVVYDASEHVEESVAFSDVWVAPSGAVFAVADPGPIVHFDGTTWEELDGGRSTNLLAVWGLSDTDVYATGYNRLLHHDGSTWQTVLEREEPKIEAVWGTSSSNLYTAGLGGILRFDGATWEQVFDGGTFNGIWGAGAGHLVAVGSFEILIRKQDVWDDSKEKGLSLMDVWGLSEDEFYAVGCKWRHSECFGIIIRYTCR